jgi:hypothetical protein
MAQTQKTLTRGKEPLWWTPAIEASWSRDLDEVMASYQSDQPGVRLLRWVARRAVGFGFGARKAHHLNTWGEVESTLQKDWALQTSRPEATWERVTAAIRYGWDTALLQSEAKSTV